MDECCAPQWADFTRSPCLPSDSYFEMEHEVHRSRRQAEELAAEFKTRFDNMPANFEIEVNTEPENSSMLSSQVKLSFFVPMDNQDTNKAVEKFIPHRTVQSLRLGDPSKNIKKRLSEEIASLRRRTNTLGRRRPSQVGGQTKVLTCQYVKKYPTKNRRHSNQYISLAEAVSKFQSEMPQRFRMPSNKNLKPMLPIKTKQKLTYPVSPALRCKHRTRTVAKPEPAKVTNESMVAPRNISKKPAPTIKEPCTNLPKKAPENKPPPEVKPKPVHTVEKVCPTIRNVPEVVPRKNENPTNNGKPPLPASFEARNRELQMKREQRVKALQEATKVKTEFHAKPAPNFAKKPAATAREQPHKKAVAPCPFSFDQRDRCLARKKEERIKQLQENVKKPHVFHANPVPSYKPVSVRCTSKESLRNKESEARKQAHESQPKTSQKKPASKPEPLRQIKPVMLNRDKEASKQLHESQPKTSQKKPASKPEPLRQIKPVMLNRDKEASKQAHESQPKPSQKKPASKPEPLRQIKSVILNRDKEASKQAHESQPKPTQKKLASKPEPLRQIKSVILNRDNRPKERCELDEKIRRKRDQEETGKRERERNRLNENRQEQAELRKLTETRARPMPVYKLPIILKSSKSLTDPKSPAWASRPKSMKQINQ